MEKIRRFCDFCNIELKSYKYIEIGVKNHNPEFDKGWDFWHLCPRCWKVAGKHWNLITDNLKPPLKSKTKPNKIA